MSLKAIPTEKMIPLSAAWLGAAPGGFRKSLSALPLVAPLLATLQDAHDGLLATTQRPADDGTIAKLKAEAAELDGVHDRKVRGIQTLLTGLADLTDDPDDASRYLALRDTLFPDGIAFINRDYTFEVGLATLTAQRIDKADKKLLAKIPLPGGKLQDAVDAWFLSAKKLGDLDGKRASAESAQGTGPTASDAVKARNRWIRAVNAMVANLELDAKATPELTEQVLAALRDAEAKAARRRGAAPEAPAAAEPTAKP